MALGLHLLGSSGFDLPGVVNAFRLGPGRGEMGFCWKGLVRHGGRAPSLFEGFLPGQLANCPSSGSASWSVS
jgi:hypothetical protein